MDEIKLFECLYPDDLLKRLSPLVTDYGCVKVLNCLEHYHASRHGVCRNYLLADASDDKYRQLVEAYTLQITFPESLKSRG